MRTLPILVLLLALTSSAHSAEVNKPTIMELKPQDFNILIVGSEVEVGGQAGWMAPVWMRVPAIGCVDARGTPPLPYKTLELKCRKAAGECGLYPPYIACSK